VDNIAGSNVKIATAFWPDAPRMIRAHSPLAGRTGDKAAYWCDGLDDDCDGWTDNIPGTATRLSEPSSWFSGEKSPKPSFKTAVVPARPRDWFPSSFLFDPLVATDESGHARVDVKVPDTLTTWRVLALAHARNGAQAGAVSRFVGTLPSYVDPVVPSELRVGDEVRLPIMVVSSEAQPASVPLQIQAEGAALSGAPQAVRIAAAGTQVELITLKANEPGTLTLHAILGGADDVTRTVPVRPDGRPITEHRSGTLAGSRELAITLPDDAREPGANAHLTAYPGALAIVRSELAHAETRGSSIADHAYALLLAGNAPTLLKSMGGAADDQLLRRLTLEASQLAVADARTEGATLDPALVEAALAHREDRVLSQLGERLCEQLAETQLPDGTFGDEANVQRMLVTTAEAVQAIRAGDRSSTGRARAAGASVRVEGAFERYLAQIEDPYTAAAVAASGVMPPGLMERLRDVIRAAVTTDESGARRLTLPDGLQRADGAKPNEIDASALALLALDPQQDAALRADLGSVLLASYSPASGWGDGRTNLVALRAVVDFFKDPMPERITVKLLVDGAPLAQGSLDARHGDLLALDAPLRASWGRHTWSISAEPPVAGLGFSLDVTAYRRWKAADEIDGLRMESTVPKGLHVGDPAEIAVRVSAPASEPLTVHYALPPGVQPVKTSLDELEQSADVREYSVEGQSIRLDLPGVEEGRTTTLHFKVMPTLAGRLHPDASRLALNSKTERVSWVPSPVWEIR
jgi:hypothetical protein